MAAPAATAAVPAGARLMRRATYASIAVAGVLIVAKVVAWGMTGSVSVLSSLLDSLLDAVASAVNLFAVHHALTPADREHRFGHGKAEPLAGLAQAAFITGSAVLLLIQAAQRLRAPPPITDGEVGIAVMVLSIVLTLGLVAYQRRVVQRDRLGRDRRRPDPLCQRPAAEPQRHRGAGPVGLVRRPLCRSRLRHRGRPSTSWSARCASAASRSTC